MVAEPDQHGRDRANEGDRPFAEHTVGIVLPLIPQLTREQFPDRVRVADRERVESVAVLYPGRHHEIEHAHVVLAAEPAGQRQHLAEEVPVGLAVHQHEPRPLREGIGEQA